MDLRLGWGVHWDIALPTPYGVWALYALLAPFGVSDLSQENWKKFVLTAGCDLPAGSGLTNRPVQDAGWGANVALWPHTYPVPLDPRSRFLLMHTRLCAPCYSKSLCSLRKWDGHGHGHGHGHGDGDGDGDVCRRAIPSIFPSRASRTVMWAPTRRSWKSFWS